MHGWDQYDRRLVIVGTMNATAVLTEPADVAIYTRLFDELVAAAVFDEEARTLLAGIAADYRAMAQDGDGPAVRPSSGG